MRFFSFKKHILIFALISFVQALNAQTSRPVVSQINASPVSTNKIEVTWKLPSSVKEGFITALHVYRDIRPISEISTKKPVASLPYYAVSYTDTPGDFREYFYAVVTEISVMPSSKSGAAKDLYYDEETDSLPERTSGEIYAMILPGVNSTVNGAKISGKKDSVEDLNEKQYLLQTKEAEKKIYDGDRIREQPLPYMDILGDKNSLHERTISLEAEERAKSLLKKNPAETKKILEPYIFHEDLIENVDGDAGRLFEILKTSFIKRDYEAAEKALDDFLPTAKDEEVVQRATFYLGECHYFNGNMPEAIKCFLLLQDFYPSLCRKWTKNSLDLYVIAGDLD